MQTLRMLIESVVSQLALQVEMRFGAPSGKAECLVADATRAHKLLGWQPQINFAYAVWQLAQKSFPSLKVKQPKRSL
jgi:hypothetical protein